MNKNEKILSVSIAAYNAAKDLPRCINSFLNCRNIDDLELIIVNDGSTDNTLAVANNLYEKYPNSIKIIDKINGGHGSTINASITHSTGKYFKVVDSDDWVETDNLDRLIDMLKNTDIDLIINPYYFVDATNLTKKTLTDVSTSLEKIEYNKEYYFDNLSCNFSLAMHAMTIKTSIMKKVGPIIDEKCFYVDVEYISFPIEYINSIVFEDFPIYDYLYGTTTQSVNIKNLIKRREQHLKVCKRLVEFYYNLNIDSIVKKNIIRKTVIEMITAQYTIYFCNDSKVSLPEVKEFDIWLKENCLELYNIKPSRKNALWLAIFFRKHNYRFYNVYIMIYQLLKKIKNH